MMTLDTEERYESLSLVHSRMDCRVKLGNDKAKILADQYLT
jgi:hypothetical protein